MQKYKATKTDYGYLIIKDKKSNNYITALYYDGREVVASSHEIYSRLPSFDVPEEWEEDEIKILWGKDRLYHRFEFDSFTGGYNAAKEKYKWTDEDMEKCWDESSWQADKGERSTVSFMGFIKSLSKPKEYEVELEEESIPSLTTHGKAVVNISVPKITNNKVKILNYKLL